MMKKTVWVLLTLVLVISLLMGCSISAPDLTSEPSVPSSETGGVIIRDVPFELIEDFTEGELAVMIEQLKVSRGYAVIQRNEAELLLFIGAGEKRSGGYGITVVKAQEAGGTLNIIAEETSPDPEDMVIMMITYPYTIVSVKMISDSITVVDQEGTPYDIIDLSEEI